MLSSKITGWSLTMGFVTLVILMAAGMIEGDHADDAAEIAWIVENNDWKWLVPMTMVGGLTMLVFTAGMISWVRSIDESNGALTYATYFPLLGLMVSWVGIISGGAGADMAKDNADAAIALLQLSNISGFLGVVMMMITFFLVGTTAYLKKSGTPALMGLLGLGGIVGAIGCFIPGFGMIAFMVIFPLNLILVAIIGIQKVRT